MKDGSTVKKVRSEYMKRLLTFLLVLVFVLVPAVYAPCAQKSKNVAKHKVVQVQLPPYIAPGMPVRAAILYNMTTGKILYERNANARIPPASLTKLMTLYLAFDAIKRGKLKLQRRVTVSREAARTGGSSMHLRPGEKVTLSNLLLGTAVASGNDAAVAVAQTVQPSRASFVSMMNAKARALKMRNTTFVNPTGLPAQGQFTTPRDMLTLALSYLSTHPTVMRFHSLSLFTHRGRLLTTTNSLLGSVCGVNGLKTGWTVASGYNIIVTAERNKTRLLLVVMGGKSRVSRDIVARQLLEAGFRSPKSSGGVVAYLTGKRGKRQQKRAS